MIESCAYSYRDATFRDGDTGHTALDAPLSCVRGIVCMAMLVMSVNVCAGSQQPFRPWQPTPFRPKVTPVRNGEVELSRQSAALRRESARITAKDSTKRAQALMEQRLAAIRKLARELEQTTEDSLTQGGLLQQSAADAKLDKNQVDSAVKDLKAAAPKMREAGKLANDALDKVGGTK